ncbi:hypothetical protein bcgnr5390_10890 [Bacillus luti]
MNTLKLVSFSPKTIFPDYNLFKSNNKHTKGEIKMKLTKTTKATKKLF